MDQPSEVIASLDIGTSKVCVVTGRRAGDAIHILGCGVHESSGIRQGRVVDVNALYASIGHAVDEAEVALPFEIQRVVVGVCGPDLRTRDAVGRSAVPTGVVTGADVERARRQAMRVPEDGQVLLHDLTSEYELDGSATSRNPVGAQARQLGVRVHEIYVDAGPLVNLHRACGMRGLEVEGFVLEPLACGRAILMPAEREQGTVLVDIGGETTDVGIWYGGRLVQVFVLPQGGDLITARVAQALGVDADVAHRIKERSGSALSELVDTTETILLPSREGERPRHFSRRLLAQIIEPCLEELFVAVGEEIARSPWTPMLQGGYVLSGGAAAMTGCETLAQRILDAPVRAGVPMGVTGYADVVREPRFATAVGLLHHALHHTHPSEIHRLRDDRLWMRVGRGVKELWHRIF